MSRPVERPEPIGVLRWLGDEPRLSEQSGRTCVVDAAGIADIVQSYAAKGGGLRFVPASAGGLAASKVFREASEHVARHTTLATTSTGMTIQREARIRMAEEDPSAVVEVGVLGSHHGIRVRPDGAREHLFRVSLLGTVGVPSVGGGTGLPMTVDGVAEHAVVDMQGVREVDQADVWFSVWRNASILLGENLRAAVSEAVARDGSGTLEARVTSDGTRAWPAVVPGPHAPLEWLRPAGELIGPDGRERLGAVLERIEPSRGFLNPSNLKAEDVRPGDVLAYRAGAPGNPRVSPMRGGAGAAGDRVLAREVLSRMAAGVLASTGGETPDLATASTSRGNTPLIQVLVEEPTIEETSMSTEIEGNWRCRLWSRGVPDAGDPDLKVGIARREARRYESGRPPLLPRDRNAELTIWARSALQQVVAKAVERGLVKAVGADVPAAKEGRSGEREHAH